MAAMTVLSDCTEAPRSAVMLSIRRTEADSAGSETSVLSPVIRLSIFGIMALTAGITSLLTALISPASTPVATVSPTE